MNTITKPSPMPRITPAEIRPIACDVPPSPQPIPSQTRDYIDDLHRTCDVVYTQVQEVFKRIDPILRAGPPCETEDKPQRDPETILNRDLHELLMKLDTMNGFLQYNLKRIAI